MLKRAISLLVALVVGGLAAAGPAAAQALYWLDTRWANPTLHRCNPDGTGGTSLALPAGTLPEGLALDPTAVKLYWGEAAWTSARVRSAPLDFVAPQTVLAGFSSLRGLAVDETSRRLYWTGSNLITGPALYRSYLDGTGSQVIVSLGLAANPRGVAADVPMGKVFWTDLAQNTIGWANLDGSGAAVWASLGSGTGPYGIAVDTQNQLVYWTEYASGRIRRSAAGGGPITVLVSGLGNPTYLALDLAGGRMFWSEAAAGAQRIQRASLGGASVLNLGQAPASYGGLAFASTALLAAPTPPPVRVSLLAAVSPNPARGAAHLDWSLAREGAVRVSVVDVQGREVAVLADEVEPAGRHQTDWTAPVPGVYFARLNADGRVWQRRFAVVR